MLGLKLDDDRKAAAEGSSMRRRSNSASPAQSLPNAWTPKVRKSLLCGLPLLIFSGLAPTPAAAQQAVNIGPTAADQNIINNNSCVFVGDCIFISTINGALINLVNNGSLSASGGNGNGIHLISTGQGFSGSAGSAGGTGNGSDGSDGGNGAAFTGESG